MKKIKLTDIAPYSGRRVQPFSGAKRYMSTGDLKEDNLSFEDVSYETKPSRADILVSEGDILFAKMTNTNKALQIDKELDGIIVSTGFSVHRPLENELYGEYFLHFLKHYSFQRQKNKLCTGAIQSAISNSGIEKIFVPVPDYKDQLHIANLLSKAERLIAQRKESIRLLDEFLKSTFLEMFGECTKNEKNWEKIELKYFGEIITGNTPPRNNDENYSSNFIEWIKTDNIPVDDSYITNAVEYLSETGLKYARTVEAGALLVACIAGSIQSVGRAALTNRKVSFNQQINAIQPNEEIEPLYLYWLFKISRKYIQDAASNGMKKILTKGGFEKIKMIKPPFSLQTQFAQIVEKTETLKTQYQKSLQELENLNDSLSQKAFRGELSLKGESLLMAAEHSLIMAAEPEVIYTK